MERIKIITDSTGYIPKKYIDENNISVIPLHYSLGGEMKKEGFPGEFTSFFKELENTDLFPTTSQPSTGDFLEEFKRAFDEGYEGIIAILLSSELSGTYNNALIAKNMLEDERISIIDSRQSVASLRFLVENATNMVKEGKKIKEIVDYIENKKNNIHVYFTINTLEYLKRGGRLTTFKYVIGSALNIKPIIQLKDGELKPSGKVRGKNNSIKAITENIYPEVERISICHILNEEEALKLKEKLSSKFPKAFISIDELGPVIGGHLGTKGIGLCFY